VKKDLGKLSFSFSSTPSSSTEAGFALLEVIVAMAIMALVGLMAWRGMDALIRGRETIDRHANDDAAYTQLVRQFDKDCQEILRRDELNVTTSAPTPANPSAGAVVGLSAALPTIVTGSKTIWWMRHYRADSLDAWLLVGYGMGPAGLQRLISQPLLSRTQALSLWSNVAREPDLVSTDLVVSYELPSIVRQTFVVQAPSTSGTTLASTSDQQGIQMQWWLKDVTFPITRSCLLGGAL